MKRCNSHETAVSSLIRTLHAFHRIRPFLLTNVGITVVAACMCRPIIEFSQAVYIIDTVFHLVLAGYQPAWATWYIALIPQALALCLIYTHKPEGRRPEGACVYIRQSTRACGISITCVPLSHLRSKGKASAYILYCTGSGILTRYTHFGQCNISLQHS